MCDLTNILKNGGLPRGAVLKLFKKLRLQHMVAAQLADKNYGTAQLADKICVFPLHLQHELTL